jgi:hypothetical protein
MPVKYKILREPCSDFLYGKPYGQKQSRNDKFWYIPKEQILTESVE